MMRPVSQGGTIATSPEGGIWIEEFPTDPPSLVLGSFIDTIIVLHQVATLFPSDAQARADFDAAVASLKMSLKHYDTGNSTLVYRWPGLSSPALADEVYGPAFPRLMGELAEITNDRLVLVTSLRWRSFYEDVHERRAGNVHLDAYGKFRVGMGLPKREIVDVLKGNNVGVVSV